MVIPALLRIQTKKRSSRLISRGSFYIPVQRYKNYISSNSLLVRLAIAGKINPKAIKAIGVMILSANWNHHDEGSVAIFILGTIPRMQAKAVKKKAHSPKPKPTYLFLTNI